MQIIFSIERMGVFIWIKLNRSKTFLPAKLHLNRRMNLKIRGSILESSHWEEIEVMKSVGFFILVFPHACFLNDLFLNFPSFSLRSQEDFREGNQNCEH